MTMEQPKTKKSFIEQIQAMTEAAHNKRERQLLDVIRDSIRSAAQNGNSSIRVSTSGFAHGQSFYSDNDLAKARLYFAAQGFEITQEGQVYVIKW